MHPPLVVLADISGSMSQYTRMLAAFRPCAGRAGARAHLRLRHAADQSDPLLKRTATPDEALAGLHGGGAGLVRRHAHRLRQRCTSSTGCGRAACCRAGRRRAADHRRARARRRTMASREEMERLHKSCRRLIWLNPLLRFDGFEARAQGIRAMLPHVDEFRAVHNLEALIGPVRVARTKSTSRRPIPRFDGSWQSSAPHDHIIETRDCGLQMARICASVTGRICSDARISSFSTRPDTIDAR
jgi:hypothetical protein